MRVDGCDGCDTMLVCPRHGERKHEHFQYDVATDDVVYGCDRTLVFTKENWIRLALAALDQANMTPTDLYLSYRRNRECVDDVVIEQCGVES